MKNDKVNKAVHTDRQTEKVRKAKFQRIQFWELESQEICDACNVVKYVGGFPPDLSLTTNDFILKKLCLTKFR